MIDGMHNDARMNVTLAISAAAFGATVANYVKVESLTTRADGQLDGATVINQIADETGRKERFAIKAKGIINATGPFTDSLRQMADPQAADIVAPSSGTHLVLPARFGPGNLGVLDPATSDGRVLFLLPWLGHMIAGTTDDACALTQEPAPQGEEIAWILRELNRYMRPGFKIGPEDVLSAWTGIRPLVRDPSKSASQGLVRNHLITKSENGLITIAGGKWTTYRQMAEETIDEAIKDFRLDHKVRDGYDLPLLTGSVEYEEPVKPDRNCQTLGLKLIGAHGWSPELSKSLSKRSGLESDVSEHLATAYGDRAWQVSQLCDSDNDLVQGARLAPHLPFVDAEVLHAIRSEYAQTIVDVVSRRMRLAFLDVAAARTALPEISRIMCTELGWNTERQQQEEREALQFLKTMVSPHFRASTPLDSLYTGLRSDQNKSQGATKDSGLKFQGVGWYKIQNLCIETVRY
jgi:glycerol-3-phosphate dehydrogenase